MKTIRLLCVIMLLGASCVYGQGITSDVSKTGTSAATFLEIPVGAPAIGMGGAFVSLAQDATVLYWNPAGAALLPQSDFIVSHTGWIAGTRFDFGGLVLPLGSVGNIGLSITMLSMDDMKVRTVDQPEGTGELFSAGDMAAGISYARALTDRFAIGFTAKYIRQTIWHESAQGFAIDAGTFFRTDLFGGMVIGATITNFGTKMQMSGRDTRQFISVNSSQLGTNSQIPSDIEMDSWGLPLLLQFGVSTSIVNSKDYHLTVAADALHPSDNYESMNVGTELAYSNTLFFRTGYQSLFLTNAEGGYSFGLGIASRSLISSMAVRFDYAYRNMGRLDNVQTFSLDVAF